MENNNVLDSNSELQNLVKELSEGRDLAKQLQTHLNLQSSSSHETRDFLLHRILYSYDRALAMLGHDGPGGATAFEAAPPQATAEESPRSLAGSPPSDDSDQDKDHASRKRKGLDRWTQKVKVTPERGIEGQLDDGYAWRKYGQKDILGAKYPRGYYRCTHRNGQGCLATKQVQRCDDDPTTFEITYRRKHTCNPRTNSTYNNNNNPPVPMPDPQNENPNPSTRTQRNQEQPPFNIQTSLRVITQNLGTNDQNPPFDPFNFPSSSTINPENNLSFPDNSSFLGDYSPSLISPETPGSNYYQSPTNIYRSLIPDLPTSGSEITPIVAAMTSATNSPTVGSNYPFGNTSEFGSDFGFGDPGYYP